MTTPVAVVLSLAGNHLTLRTVRVHSIMMLDQPLRAPHSRLVHLRTSPSSETHRRREPRARVPAPLTTTVHLRPHLVEICPAFSLLY